MIPVLDPEEMRRMDEFTIKELGVPDPVLMEIAGRGCFSALEEHADDLAGARMVVICGKGNNGGDGLVVARYAAFAGADVRVYLLGNTSDLKSSPKIYAGVLEKLGVEIRQLSEPSQQLEHDIANADVVVDAIFGTGFKGAAKGLAAWAIEAINTATGLVMCVDIASGVEAGTGAVHGPAVAGDLTCTMAYPKLGHYLYPGKLMTGELRVVDIGIPPQQAEKARRFLTEAEDVAHALPVRLGNENKSDFGRVGLVAGSWQFSGAAVLATVGALRSGAGICYTCVPESLRPHLVGAVPESILVPLPEEKGAITAGAVKALQEIKIDALAIGPGLGRSPKTKQGVLEIIREMDIPAVVDADGIWAISDDIDALTSSRKSPLILTPHPGEMSLLVQMEPRVIDAQRLRVAEEFAEKHPGVVLVLKGAPTVIATHERSYLNTTGNPGMATGGSGDVLAGIVAGLLAQGLDPEDAAAAGTYIHGLAGDIISQEMGQPGALPMDLAQAVAQAINQVLSHDASDID